jgi:hypothetical protein
MNRRGFFKGLLGAAAGVAISDQLVEALQPKRAIFLPPRGGWYPAHVRIPPRYIREARQFDINNDVEFYRYDVFGRDANGAEEQHAVQFPQPLNAGDQGVFAPYARELLEKRLNERGLTPVDPLAPALFRPMLLPFHMPARYV